MSFNLASPTALFHHREYGNRLLFRNGIANRRDELGKNGVTVHSWFASLFYRTLSVRATAINDKGEQVTRVFYVNRKSLIKYIGPDVNTNMPNADLFNALQTKLWNDVDDRQKEMQEEAGEQGLRHAGQHNQRLMNHWWVRFTDSIKASFLGSLYQSTIGGINRIKARFLFVRNERDILEAGEILAEQRVHDSYQTVPAYKKHIDNHDNPVIREPQLRLRDVPVTTKTNYIKAQDHDSDTHLHGKYPKKGKTDTSTGTTGKPTEWVRGQQEIETVKKSLQLAAKLQFGSRRLSYINAFALGPWATGLTTYELMRETGSVFATGPDKEKIIDKLVAIADYEMHQLELAVDKLQHKYRLITDENKQLMREIINTTLTAVLRNPNLNLKRELIRQFNVHGDEARALMKRYQSSLVSITERLNQEKEQVVIAGYPPFLKDLTAYAQVRGYDFNRFSAVGVVGGQAISEAMRDQLMMHGFTKIYSSYGASDLDINLGVEGDDEIFMRKAIERNPGLARELYGANKGLPMIFHYDPMNYHVEVDNENELIFTATRTDRSSPRVRYDLGDKGRVYAASDVQAALAKHGIFHQLRTNLPLMFVWGRDSTVVFNGANLAFTELERAITDNQELEPVVLKKAFYNYLDAEGNEKLEIWLELNDGIDIPTPGDAADHAKHLIKDLAQLNQDFRYQLEALDLGTELPAVRFFKRNQSPISEPGGHRKQVLIFQRGVNLDAAYEFPQEGNSYGVAIPMAAEILEVPAAAAAM